MSAKYILLGIALSLQYLNICSLDSCETRSTCQACIRDPSVCVWCAMDKFDGIRCKSQSSYEASWCPESLQNPINLAFASETQQFSSNSDHVVQIKPQRYNIKLRPGKSQDFEFSFQAAQDFPVDLYFLLDASDTMEDVKAETAKQSERIYSAIKNMTKNVYLGLGTFVDKRVLPFTNTFDTEKTYSFRHRLKLADDFNQFKEVVSKTPPGINRDEQEGGLDALAQVLVCKEIIGWRNESRKIILFLTNGPYHAAGDGKSAGLFQPYDGQCYTQNSSYTKELVMDYPSVGMINKLAAERDIIIIFLVPSQYNELYSSLSGAISGSKLAPFEINKNDIVHTLGDIYKNITKKIKLKVNVRSGQKKNFQVTFNPDCTKDTSSTNSSSHIDCNVEVGKEQPLVGTIKLLEYYGSDNATVDIIVEGISEKLTLDVEIIKDCDCHKEVEEDSKFCNGGKKSCGLCNCCNDKYGARCSCQKSGNNTSTDNSTCIAEGSSDICNGHGSCVCGTCKCRPRYEGKFCDCNMDSCPRTNGLLCNGHGECYCGKCKCAPEWSGEACECYNSGIDCIGNGDKICSNRGHCVCGTCECDPIAEWDARDSQDRKCKMNICPDCIELQCRKLEQCAKCRRSGNNDCISCDERINTVVLKTLPREYLNNSEWNICSQVKIDAMCYTTFVYRYNDIDYSVKLVASEESDCAKTFLVFGATFLLVLLVVGACTLVSWKLLTYIRDRNEYLRFMENKGDVSGPNSNPLYQPPSTTFKNPGFRKRSVDFR